VLNENLQNIEESSSKGGLEEQPVSLDEVEVKE
jgi:hypothetical protein